MKAPTERLSLPENEPTLDFPFKIGDKVQSKLNPDQQGEICCISYATNSVRVYSDVPFGKAVVSYNADEIEIAKENP